MKIQIPNKLTSNAFNILRKAGYLRIIDHKLGKESFTRKISTGHYPRFHIYIQENPEQITIDLHLDQNENRYEGQIAHNADYNSDQVRDELQRVFEMFKGYIQAENMKNISDKNQPAPQKKNWLQRFLDF